MATWAERIKTLRKRFGISQAGLSELIGAATQTINKWENGHMEATSNCDMRLLELLEQYPNEGMRILSDLRDRKGMMTFGESESFPEKVARLRAKFNLSTYDLADVLGMSYQTIQGWERGAKTPRGCGDVMIDLLDLYVDELAPIFWPKLAWRSIEPEPKITPQEIEWPRTRVLMLRRSLGLKNVEFAELLHADQSVTSRWATEELEIGPCYHLLLHLLETYGPPVADLIASLPKEDVVWTAQDVQDLRHMLGFSRKEMEELLGQDMGERFVRWEYRGAGTLHGRCSPLLLSLLQAYPEEMVDFLRRLPRD